MAGAARSRKAASLAHHPLHQVVKADEAKPESWLDDEYVLGPKVRDVEDHGACEAPVRGSSEGLG